MAIIKRRNGVLSLYPSGLVKMSDGLHEVIVSAVETQYKKSLQAITKKLFLTLIQSFFHTNPASKPIYSNKGRIVLLTMFIHDIRVNGDSAMVDIELTLPLLAEQQEHSQVLNLLLEKVAFAGMCVQSGGLRFQINLKDDYQPVEIKHAGSNGQKSFVLISEIPKVS